MDTNYTKSLVNSYIRIATLLMEEAIGKIIHYYDRIGVAVVRLDAELAVGDTVHVKGKATDFVQTVGSMQLNHRNIEAGNAGEEVAVKLDKKAREGDVLYKIQK